MSVTVVDASAVAAVLFDEPEAAAIVAGAGSRLVAPALLRYEVASVCTTKLRRDPNRSARTLTRYALLDEMAIEFVEPDWASLPALADRWSLSAYDAAYLQVALARAAPLVTLDARLARAHDLARQNRE
jgi:predicted nucleic acid-binding protein